MPMWRSEIEKNKMNSWIHDMQNNKTSSRVNFQNIGGFFLRSTGSTGVLSPQDNRSQEHLEDLTQSLDKQLENARGEIADLKHSLACRTPQGCWRWRWRAGWGKIVQPPFWLMSTYSSWSFALFWWWTSATARKFLEIPAGKCLVTKCMMYDPLLLQKQSMAQNTGMLVKLIS